MNDLAARPELQERCRQEVKTVLAKHNNKFSVSVVEEFTLLEACMRESQRLRGALMTPIRRATEDMEINGYRIPEGTYVGGCAGYVHSLESTYGADYAEYRPERWMESRLKCLKFNLSFGSGLHMCPGRQFAITEITTLIALLLCRFELSGSKVAPRCFETEAVVYPMTFTQLSEERRVVYSSEPLTVVDQ